MIMGKIIKGFVPEKKNTIKKLSILIKGILTIGFKLSILI